jgi:hypothetical protein
LVDPLLPHSKSQCYRAWAIPVSTLTLPVIVHPWTSIRIDDTELNRLVVPVEDLGCRKTVLESVWITGRFIHMGH